MQKKGPEYVTFSNFRDIQLQTIENMESRSDEEIMLKVKEGETELLSVLFNRHQKHLFNFLLHQGIDYHKSEDYLQQIFYRILKYRKSYREDASFKTWMFSIARNVVKRDYERQKIKYAQMCPLTEAAYVADADENSLREEELKQLYASLEKLSVTEREIINLSRFQGLKYEAISEITGLSNSAIKVKMHRAMNKLRTYYFQQA